MPKERQRPKILKSVTYKSQTDHGALYVTITYKTRQKPFEVFVALGYADPCTKAWIEALSRSISVGLRYGVPPVAYVQQLYGIACVPVPDSHYGGFIKSPADAIAQVLQEFISGGSDGNIDLYGNQTERPATG